jgi:ribosomal protein L37E
MAESARKEFSNELLSITCPRCGKRSYNLNDIRELYCGFCKLFHPSEPQRERI